MDAKDGISTETKGQTENDAAPERTLPVQLGPAEKAIAEVRSTFGLELPLAERSEQLRELARMHAVAVAGELDGLGRQLQRTIIDLKRMIAPQAMTRQEAGAQKGKGVTSDSTPFTKPQLRRQRELAAVPEDVVDRVFEEAERRGEVPSEKEILEADKPRRRTAERKQKQAEALAADPGPDSRVFECRCIDLDRHVEAGTLDAIFTDPPYAGEHLDCWAELESFAWHALRPGGLLLAYSGQLHLLDAAKRLFREGRIEYRWCGTLAWPDSQAKVHPVRITHQAKPLLVGKRAGAPLDVERYGRDYFAAPPKVAGQRAAHEWGQNPGLAALVAKDWLRPGERVADPFIGGGVLARAAMDVGCIVVGCDIEPVHVAAARLRLAG